MTFWTKPELLILPFALVIAGCATAQDTVAVTPTEDPAADEALYMKRFEAQRSAAIEGGGLPAYDPLEHVRGVASYLPLPSAKGRIGIDALLQAEKFAEERKSSTFLVWHDGALVMESYFAGADRNYLVNSKSLAKPLTAIIIGRAIQQGHLKSLDQPVADFITEWKNDPGKSKIRIRHLLDMRTGLLPQGFGEGPEHVLNRAYLHPRHDEVIINEYPLVNEPGSRYEYANANSELVAPLIERATGQRYHDYVSDALLIPIGAQGGTVWVNRPGGTAHSGCCIQLPGQTWARLGILLLNNGLWEGKELLPEGYVSKMRAASAENPHAGLGVWIAGKYVKGRGPLNPSIDAGKTLHSEPYADKDLFLFDGNGSQVVYIVPSQKLVIVRTGGRPTKDKPWDNSYIPNLIIDAIERGPGDTAPVPQERN
ncbi:serine hydrolase [Parasphingorhabdus sp.]|uniref:serine hydrolase domain-containing protein n=1 Tax=Parasphingorhabdus sp. TaxID=2709688 RepID=UPI0032672301